MSKPGHVEPRAHVNEHRRECLALEVDTSLPVLRVIRVLAGLAATRGLAEEIRVDNGPEFVCTPVRAWCEHRRIVLRYIEPGRPMQNGYVNSFLGRFREECLNANWFRNLAEAPCTIEAWRRDCNSEHPHGALDYRTPSEFAALLTRSAGDKPAWENSTHDWFRFGGQVTRS